MEGEKGFQYTETPETLHSLLQVWSSFETQHRIPVLGDFSLNPMDPLPLETKGTNETTYFLSGLNSPSTEQGQNPNGFAPQWIDSFRFKRRKVEEREPLFEWRKGWIMEGRMVGWYRSSVVRISTDWGCPPPLHITQARLLSNWVDGIPRRIVRFLLFFRDGGPLPRGSGTFSFRWIGRFRSPADRMGLLAVGSGIFLWRFMWSILWWDRRERKKIKVWKEIIVSSFVYFFSPMDRILRPLLSK